MLRRLFLLLLVATTRIAELFYQGEGIATLMLILPTQMIRRVLNKYGATLGNDVRFRSPLILHNVAEKNGRNYFGNLIVGDGCYFGKAVFLDLKDRIVIEECVTVAMQVTVITHTDVGNSPLSRSIIPVTQAPVVICRGAYVGARATILQGVEIGECAVVAAGAVVTKSVPPFSVVAGVPAKAIREFMAPNLAEENAS